MRGGIEMKSLAHGTLLFFAALLWSGCAAAAGADPMVRMETNMGAIEIELDPARAPATVANFLRYARSGFYDGTLFHRVIPGFMIQGGGLVSGMRQKPTGVPIKNEAGNGLKNLAGTVAMARTSDPNSATAQFFINTADNAFLDHRDETLQGWGYCVFGKVVAGMDAVRRIEAVPTRTVGPFQNVPATDVVIEKVEVLNDESSEIDDARFAAIAEKYRSADPKPAVTEDMRRLNVMALTAVREKRFFDALHAYDEGLKLAPWWPEAHFNKAMILGELHRYGEAIRDMKRYLQLVPNAPNARAAQDKIYEWESKPPR